MTAAWSSFEQANQRRLVMETTRLLEAYLDGYRPPDWPGEQRRTG